MHVDFFSPPGSEPGAPRERVRLDTDVGTEQREVRDRLLRSSSGPKAATPRR
jgi:hypothetical protein